MRTRTGRELRRARRNGAHVGQLQVEHDDRLRGLLGWRLLLDGERLALEHEASDGRLRIVAQTHHQWQSILAERQERQVRLLLALLRERHQVARELQPMRARVEHLLADCAGRREI